MNKMIWKGAAATIATAIRQDRKQTAQISSDTNAEGSE